MSIPLGGGPWWRSIRFAVVPVAGLMVLLLPPGMAATDDKTAAAISAGLLPLLATEPDAADAEQRDIMPMTQNLPWGAIGFVDNGCTGTLIDNQHVLAASHCFTFDYDGRTAGGTPYLQGAWQNGLVFFPNYHPARPNPRRYAIDRAIVGSRIQDSPAPSPSADWGIGHLTTPVTGFPSLALAPMEHWQYPNFVVFAGYARDKAVYPREAASYPQPAPGGYCANFSNNCWWIPAFVDPKCLAIEEQNGIVRIDGFSCLVQGGNSGSPVIWDAGGMGSPAYRVTGVISGGGGFWSASRFQHAPRFAAGLAVATYDDGTQRTQLFAADRDLERVVSRYRSDASASGSFTYFRDLGAVPSPGALAAFQLQNGKPQVVVVSGNGSLYTNHAGAGGQWQRWQTLASPAGLGGFLDIAVTTDAAGLPQLYAVGVNHAVYTMRATSASSGAIWGPWSTLALGVDAQRVSVIRHRDGHQQVFVVSTTGTVHSVWQMTTAIGLTWSAPIAFGGATLPPITNVSAAWTPDGRVQLFAVDQSGNGWSRTATSLSPLAGFGPWASWAVPLYAPKAATPPRLEGIISLTASRWLESGAIVVPVVFATDRQGNIYVTTYANGLWTPWRSFYN